MTDRVHVLGASGRSGSALIAALLTAGIPVVPVVRSAARWAATGLAATPRLADLGDRNALRSTLADATRIVSCAHARHAGAILSVSPATARHVFLGSTRKFTRWPDEHGNGVILGETAFFASSQAGVMLHPTMIYGAEGEDNVRRLATLLAWLPLVPLPGGGRSLVQPIHQDDVTRAMVAALDIAWDGPQALTICGPSPVTYATFVHRIADAAGLRRPCILPVPAAPLIALAAIAARLPWLPRIRPEEIRRLLEDKAFDPAPMRAHLGFTPISLETGLARSFGGWRKTPLPS